MSVLCHVCCQVEVSVSGWSLVPRSHTERDVPECERRASIMRSWPTRDCCAVAKMLLLPPWNDKNLSNFNRGPNRDSNLAPSRYRKWRLQLCAHQHQTYRLLHVDTLYCWYTVHLAFRHRASCILGQAFHYSPEKAFYIFNQQIYFIIWYLLDRASLT